MPPDADPPTSGNGEGSHPPVKWTLSRAADEFGVHRATLRKALLQLGAEPNEGTYSTRQVFAALAGDRDREDYRRAKAEADLAEMKRDEEARRLIPKETAVAVMDELLGDLRNAVLALPITGEQRVELMAALRNVTAKDYDDATRAGAPDTSAED